MSQYAYTQIHSSYINMYNDINPFTLDLTLIPLSKNIHRSLHKVLNRNNDKPSTQTNSVTLKPQEKYNHFTDTANKILTTQIKTTAMYKPP